MVYKTEIEWLRAQWMNLHGYSRDAESDFALFAAPDLTAEEIRDCEFGNLESLVEFVQQEDETEGGIPDGEFFTEHEKYLSDLNEDTANKNIPGYQPKAQWPPEKWSAGTKELDKYEIAGYEVVEKTVRPGNQCSARLNLPLSWQGLRIKVVRLDPLPEVVEE